MENCHPPLLWVIFIHDTHDCDVSVINSMQGIYPRCLFV